VLNTPYPIVKVTSPATINFGSVLANYWRLVTKQKIASAPVHKVDEWTSFDDFQKLRIRRDR